jgi:hypothetical protein
MVLGSILNWVVGRTLDFTLDSAIWITKTTGIGLINAGYYLVNYRNQTNQNQIEDTNKQIQELLNLTKDEIIILREQNQLLKKEIINITTISDVSD